jgi:predicted RNase H-like nuclease (RuvC/YqgF family)
MRQELEDQHQQQAQVAECAEGRCRESEEEIQRCRASIAKLKEEAADLMRQNRELKHHALSGSSWASPSLLREYSEPSAQV